MEEPSLGVVEGCVVHGKGEVAGLLQGAVQEWTAMDIACCSPRRPSCHSLQQHLNPWSSNTFIWHLLYPGLPARKINPGPGLVIGVGRKLIKHIRLGALLLKEEEGVGERTPEAGALSSFSRKLAELSVSCKPPAMGNGGEGVS